MPGDWPPAALSPEPLLWSRSSIWSVEGPMVHQGPGWGQRLQAVLTKHLCYWNVRGFPGICLLLISSLILLQSENTVLFSLLSLILWPMGSSVMVEALQALEGTWVSVSISQAGSASNASTSLRPGWSPYSCPLRCREAVWKASLFSLNFGKTVFPAYSTNVTAYFFQALRVPPRCRPACTDSEDEAAVELVSVSFLCGCF